MARTDGLIHRKLPQDAVIHTRQPVPPGTKDQEPQEPAEYERLSLDALTEQMGNLARAIENRSFVVDEYSAQAISGAASSATLSVSPTYEYMPEKIESIIVTGPAGLITLQLGDRILPLTIPTSGVLVIAPVAILLSRTDARVLSAASPGNYFLELMGVASRRFSA